MAVTIGGSGALSFEASILNANFETQINKIERQLQGLTTAATKEATAIENVVRQSAAAITAYASFGTATSFVKDIVRVRGEFQQLQVAFETMLQSKEKADKLFAEAVALAAKTPFTLQDVGTASKQLLAYGFAADSITDNLTTLGNIAAGVGAPLGDIVYLYGTLRTQGRAYTKDILQFTSRGIPIISELAKQFGVSEENVQKLVEGGRVGFPEVERAFNSLTTSGGIFFNLMQEQSKTLTGLTSNLEDAWSRMLNEIGSSNEGLFTSAIKGATSLVENYQTVLKVLQILVATYGSYRAAIIATNVATAISTGITQGYTVAETLRYQAMLLSERAMKLLNATMLANPATALVAGILSIVSALYILTPELAKAKDASELLAESEKKNKVAYEDKKRSIEVYVNALKASNVTEQEKVKIYEKIKAIDPVLVKGLNSQTISYAALTTNLKGYLDQLRNKLSIEANDAAVKESIANESKLRDQIEKTTETIALQEKFLKNDRGNTPLALQFQANVKNLKEYNEQLKKQQATTEAIAKKGSQIVAQPITSTVVAPKTNSQLIEEAKSLEVLAALQKNIQEDYDKATDNIQRKRLAKDLAHAAARKKALDIYGGLKESAKVAEKADERSNALLERRKDILEDLQALQRDSKQSGLIKEQSEIDKVNEKYDLAIKKIEEFNAKAAEFNKANPKAKVSLIGLTDIDKLNRERLQEAQNVSYKVEAENYKKSLEEQQRVFSDFEEAKKEIGIQAASDMYAEQTRGYKSFLAMLEDERADLIRKEFSGLLNIGDQEKLIAVNKEIAQTKADQAKRELEIQQAQFREFLDASRGFNEQRAEIEKRYSVSFGLLEKGRTKISVREYNERLEALRRNKEEELDAVTSNELEKEKIIRQYQNQPISELTRGAIKTMVADLEKLKIKYKDNAEALRVIVGLQKELNKETSETTLEGIRSSIALIRGMFEGLSIDLGSNLKLDLDKVADSVSNISTIISKTSTDGEKANSIVGLFTAAYRAAVKYSQRNLKDPMDAQIQALEALNRQADYTTAALDRQQKKFEELAGVAKVAQGIQYFSDLKKQTDDAYKAIEDFQLRVIEGIHTEKTSGFLTVDQIVIDFKTIDKSNLKTLDDYKALLADIIKNKNILNGQEVAKEDVETLKKLIENYDKFKEAQIAFKKQLDELFTGTNADAITASIIDGFANGYSSVEAFANKTEDLLRGAMLNALKYQVLEEPIKKLYEKFAADAESNGGLDTKEIEGFTKSINQTIADGLKFAEEVQKATGINLSSAAAQASQQNSLKGDIRANLTESTGSILAGQIGGLRMTAGQQLNVASAGLLELQRIQFNTSFLVTGIPEMNRRLANFELNGIKLR